jgi:hypothetical protein
VAMEHQKAESGGGGGDGDSRREGDGGVLVMVGAPGSRGWGSTGVGVGGTRVGERQRRWWRTEKFRQPVDIIVKSSSF